MHARPPFVEYVANMSRDLEHGEPRNEDNFTLTERHDPHVKIGWLRIILFIPSIHANNWASITAK